MGGGVIRFLPLAAFYETAALSQKQNPRHDETNQSRLVHTIQQPNNNNAQHIYKIKKYAK